MNTYEIDISLAGNQVGHLVLTSSNGALSAIEQAEKLVAVGLKNGEFDRQIKSQILIVHSVNDFDYQARRMN